MKIQIIYDNRAIKPDWNTGWGFSALIDSGDKKILFDTGDCGYKLSQNVERSGISIKDVDLCTFSHSDWDHVDGFSRFLRDNKTAKILVPYNFSNLFKAAIEKNGNPYEEIGESVYKIFSGVYSTKLYKRFLKRPEQGIVLINNENAALITGCAHPGILYMVKDVKKAFKVDVSMVLGGFHLMKYSKKMVKYLIEDLKSEGVQHFAPCHCTGEEQIKMFEEICKDSFIRLGAGSIVEFN